MIDPLAPLDVLATNAMFRDPAIDMDVADAESRLAEYRKTRDGATLVLRPEVKPTVFVCRQIPATLAQATLAGFSVHARPLFAFCAGCHLVRLPDGDELRPNKLEPTAYGAKTADLNEWVGVVSKHFGMDTVIEIGDVIYERARLPEGAKGPFGYRLG